MSSEPISDSCCMPPTESLMDFLHIERMVEYEMKTEEQAETIKQQEVEMKQLRRECQLLEEKIEALEQKQMNESQVHLLGTLSLKIAAMQEDFELHMKHREELEQKVTELESQLKRSRDECERLGQMCDEFDEIEADLKRKLYELNAEIDLLKRKPTEEDEFAQEVQLLLLDRLPSSSPNQESMLPSSWSNQEATLPTSPANQETMLPTSPSYAESTLPASPPYSESTLLHEVDMKHVHKSPLVNRSNCKQQ